MIITLIGFKITFRNIRSHSAPLLIFVAISDLGFKRVNPIHHRGRAKTPLSILSTLLIINQLSDIPANGLEVLCFNHIKNIYHFAFLSVILESSEKILRSLNSITNFKLRIQYLFGSRTESFEAIWLIF